MTRRSRRRASPRVEGLEDRIVLFQNLGNLNPVHEAITSVALPFLKPNVLATINSRHISQDAYSIGMGVLTGDYVNGDHFTGGAFQEGTQRINARYGAIIQDFNPGSLVPEVIRYADLSAQFGNILHAAQDFYAHTNWVEYGLGGRLVDDGLGDWKVLTPYTTLDRVSNAGYPLVVVEGEGSPPGGSFDPAPTPDNVTVRLPGGRYDGLVSASFQGVLIGGFSFDNTPDAVALDHDKTFAEGGLYKDSMVAGDAAQNALYTQAIQTAYLQTRHEFQRLCEKIRTAYGDAAVDRFLEDFVKPDPASQAQARELCLGSELQDIVFVIDTTGSMNDDIDAAKDSAVSLIESIHADLPGSRVGLVTYRDFPQRPFGDPGDYVARTDHPLTDDTNSVVRAIRNIVVEGGGDGPEAVYSALAHTIEARDGLGPWREAPVKRTIILMGDAPPHDPEPFTNLTQPDIDRLAAGSSAGGSIQAQFQGAGAGSNGMVSVRGSDGATVDIYTIGIGDYPTESFRAIAAANRGEYFSAARATNVVGAILAAVDQLRPTSADLAATLTGPAAGQAGTYTAKITNLGPDAATGAQLIIHLPAGANLLALESPGASLSRDGDVVTAAFGDLAVGESRTVQVTLAAAAPEKFALSAFALSSRFDTNSTNNLAALTPATAPTTTITDVGAITRRGRVSALTLLFSGAVSTAGVADPIHYRVVDLGRDGRLGTRDDRAITVRSVTFDATSRTAELILARRAAPGRQLQIFVDPRGGSSGMVDRRGQLLDGDANQAPGDPFSARIVVGAKATYRDRDGDQVQLKLKGPGRFTLVQTPDGEAVSLRVRSSRVRRASLTGSVRSRPGGDGMTRLPVVIVPAGLKLQLDPRKFAISHAFIGG